MHTPGTSIALRLETDLPYCVHFMLTLSLLCRVGGIQAFRAIVSMLSGDDREAEEGELEEEEGDGGVEGETLFRRVSFVFVRYVCLLSTASCSFSFG